MMQVVGEVRGGWPGERSEGLVGPLRSGNQAHGGELVGQAWSASQAHGGGLLSQVWSASQAGSGGLVGQGRAGYQPRLHARHGLWPTPEGSGLHIGGLVAHHYAALFGGQGPVGRGALVSAHVPVGPPQLLAGQMALGRGPGQAARGPGHLALGRGPVNGAQLASGRPSAWTGAIMGGLNPGPPAPMPAVGGGDGGGGLWSNRRGRPRKSPRIGDAPYGRGGGSGRIGDAMSGAVAGATGAGGRVAYAAYGRAPDPGSAPVAGAAATAGPPPPAVTLPLAVGREGAWGLPPSAIAAAASSLPPDSPLFRRLNSWLRKQ